MTTVLISKFMLTSETHFLRTLKARRKNACLNGKKLTMQLRDPIKLNRTQQNTAASNAVAFTAVGDNVSADGAGAVAASENNNAAADEASDMPEDGGV